MKHVPPPVTCGSQCPLSGVLNLVTTGSFHRIYRGDRNEIDLLGNVAVDSPEEPAA